MVYAVVTAVGLAVGCVEFFLLTRLVKALMLSNTLKMGLLMMIKLFLLAGALVVAFFVVPELLWLAGCAVVLPMLLGGIAAVVSARKKGEER